ncbi:MAG: hypothetical protein H5T68_03155 [Chloroflexi bacterium]|nr:hypothetical protein [Chloroflexota bacterium]
MVRVEQGVSHAAADRAWEPDLPERVLSKRREMVSLPLRVAQGDGSA